MGVDNHNVGFVRVRNGGNIHMLDGSKITGHTNASGAGHGAVSIISGGRFTMSGGTITGNTATYPDSFNTGGVRLQDANSVFNMTGGSVHGNTRADTRGGYPSAPADVYIAQNANHFTVSGTAVIDTLTLNFAAGTPDTYAFVTVGPGWTGNIGNLSLRNGVTDISIVVSRWTSASRVVQAAENHQLTLAEVGRIGNVSRRFIGTSDAVTQDFADTHEIVIEGGGTIGVLRTTDN